MTELLDVAPGARVLEVGTGSGYQAAVLLAMGASLVTIERHEGLADAARERLEALYPDADVTVVVGDGTLGHAAGAPYDRIIVTAGAPPDLPTAYREQLSAAPGSRVVLPLGRRDAQALTLFTRLGDGELRREEHEPCRFVPLVGERVGRSETCRRPSKREAASRPLRRFWLC